MSQPFIGQITMFAGNFAPRDYAFCNGQLTPISQNSALFSLIGTTFGGDGQNTFALPDMRGRSAVGQGQGPGLSNYPIGLSFGVENVTITNQTMPQHNHLAISTVSTGAVGASGAFWATTSTASYSSNAVDTAMNPQSITLAGGSQPHENRQPFLAINFIIALFGVYPSRN